MDVFTRLERAIEHVFEGLFAHRFRGRVQPVEIARRLSRSMEDHKMVSVSQVFVPNQFKVALHPEDFATIAPFQDAIMPELIRHVQESAAEGNYGLLGKPEVTLVQDDTLERGDIKIEPGFLRKEEQARRAPENPTSALSPGVSSTNRATPHQAVLQVTEGPDEGDDFALSRALNTIGRGGTNEIALTDTSVSRSHAEIALQPDGFHFRDLGSKNGSLVNGLPASDVLLNDGDLITVGATTFRFNAARVV